MSDGTRTQELPPRATRDLVGERLARAMVDLVGTRGYEGTPLDAVCGRARARREDFDQRFASKEECFLKVYDGIAADFCRRVRVAYERPRGWREQIWAAGWEAIGFLAEDPARARFFAVEVAAVGDEGRARGGAIMEVFAELVDKGRAHLEDSGSTSRATAHIVAGAIYHTIRDKIRNGDIEAGEHFLPELVYLAVFPYLGARAAEAALAVEPLR